MKKIFNKIWNQAKPYYLKGRPMDIDHIEWMIKDAVYVSKKEKLNEDLLLPLVILHDVGYAKVPKDNPFKKNMREAHMKEGAKIAKVILSKLDYPKEKISKIVDYVALHDVWALGDNGVYKKDKVLGVFNDLDFIWMATDKGFQAVMKIREINKKEMLDFLVTNEKLVNRPFSTPATKKLFDKYIEARKKEK
jgi:hypothetical protein